MSKAPHIAIIGAGIVGVSTAIWAQRAGARVTLIDREGPAAGTSYGNAGLLAAVAVVPVAVPGLMRKAPGMLLDPNQPLFLRWSYLPRLIPWLRRFLSHARASEVDRISGALTGLLADTVDQHWSLAEGTDAAKFIKDGDWVFGYADKKAFEKDHYSWRIRRQNGYECIEMEPDAIAAYDPALIGKFGYAVRCTNHGYISDPGAYVTALADHFVAEGGVLTIADVAGFDISDGKVRTVQTQNGPIEVDHAIITAGAWSQKLGGGAPIKLESERGYHVEFVNASVRLNSPLMHASGKFGITPMEGRLRCAGTVELGGLDLPPSTAPIELLKRNALELFPEMTYDRIDTWMGHRPSTTDSLPVIGQAPAARNLWLGYGHQHIGLTGGPKTGRWLAQMVMGKNPNVDLSPFDPTRRG